MEDLLMETLKEFGYPVIRQGSLTEDDEYPESFFTFWNNDSSGDGFYDNKDIRTEWDFDVNFYSTDPKLTYSEILKAKEKLRSVGFILSGKGYDVASDEPTHTGRGINALFMENNN